MTPNPTPDDDLLLAVRYVLDECESGEREALEARLADDVQAQEALVEAVRIVSLLQSTPTCSEVGQTFLSAAEVGQTFLSAEPAVIRPRSAPWRKATLLAAGLLLAVTAMWLLTPSPSIPVVVAPDPTVEDPAVPESPALTHTWTALDPAVADDADESDPEDSPETLEAAREVPDWLLTAILVEEDDQATPVDGHMETDEETQL